MYTDIVRALLICMRGEVLYSVSRSPLITHTSIHTHIQYTHICIHTHIHVHMYTQKCVYPLAHSVGKSLVEGTVGGGSTAWLPRELEIMHQLSVAR